tara:strand:+ start:244 stop:609 length:366 start_codon:yes stop_codon:yes gene_type:complete
MLVFRLVSTVPWLRRIVAPLSHAVPVVEAIIAPLLLVFYVLAVITTEILGHNFPGCLVSKVTQCYSFPNYDIKKLVHGNRPTCNGNLSVGLDPICRLCNFIGFYRIKLVYRYHNKLYADLN